MRDGVMSFLAFIFLAFSVAEFLLGPAITVCWGSSSINIMAIFLFSVIGICNVVGGVRVVASKVNIPMRNMMYTYKI